MARKRTKKQNLSDIVETYGRQLIVGTIVLVMVLAVLSTQLFKKKPSLVTNSTPTITVTSTPTVATPSASPTLKTNQAAINALTNPVTSPTAKQLVTKLPLTAGENISYTVKVGDNIAKLGETFCNDKRAWIQIAEDNKIYSPYTIQPGDILKISCPR